MHKLSIENYHDFIEKHYDFIWVSEIYPPYTFQGNAIRNRNEKVPQILQIFLEFSKNLSCLKQIKKYFSTLEKHEHNVD